MPYDFNLECLKGGIAVRLHQLNQWFIAVAAIVIGLFVVSQAVRIVSAPVAAQHQTIKQASRPTSNIGGITNSQRQSLAQLNYTPGKSVIKKVNHDRSTLNPKSWTKNQVIYGKLDAQRRTSNGNTAFLEARNHANTNLRISQSVAPTAWHNNRGGELIYNRGHLIAYSLTSGIDQWTGKYNGNRYGDQDNPKNLFTETDFTNQYVQTIYETKVRHAIERHERVIYQATPIFRGNEDMARGINLQAISTDGRLNFNVYLFNVEPGISFDYANGNSTYDKNMRVVVPYEAVFEKQRLKESYNGQFKFIGNYPMPVASHPRRYERVR